jgi:hypothetical protein
MKIPTSHGAYFMLLDLVLLILLLQANIWSFSLNNFVCCLLIPSPLESYVFLGSLFSIHIPERG